MIVNGSLIVYGWFGISRATVSASIIDLYGHKALYLGSIDSMGTDIVVTSYAHLAGDSGSMICRSGDTCLLNCKSSGCKGLDYICETGAICNIDPVQCDGTRTKFQGIDCPTKTTTVNADNFMEIKHEFRQDIYDTFDEYLSKMDDDDDYDLYTPEFMINLDEMILAKDIALINSQIMTNYDEKILIGVGCIIFVVIVMGFIWYRMSKEKNGYEAI